MHGTRFSFPPGTERSRRRETVPTMGSRLLRENEAPKIYATIESRAIEVSTRCTLRLVTTVRKVVQRRFVVRSRAYTVEIFRNFGVGHVDDSFDSLAMKTISPFFFNNPGQSADGILIWNRVVNAASERGNKRSSLGRRGSSRLIVRLALFVVRRPHCTWSMLSSGLANDLLIVPNMYYVIRRP